MGIDVIGEDAVDRLLGPNKKRAQHAAQPEGGAFVNAHPEEERPAWDDASIDMEACVDRQTPVRYIISLSYVTMVTALLRCLNSVHSR